jgi:hypothetical protein
MANLILNGSTSGSVTLSSPAVSGTTTLTLPTTSGTILTSASNTGFPTGSILQVVQGVLTGTVNVAYFSTTTNGLVDTGLSASITPSSSSNKILVIISPCIFITGATTDAATGFGIKRGATNVYSTSAIAYYSASGAATNAGTMPNIVYLDSPATTSSTTYQLQVNRYTNNGGTTVQLNRNYQAVDISTITLIEVKG